MSSQSRPTPAAAREAFRQAELEVFARYEIDVEPLFFDLERPALRTRVLASGDGPPLLFVHGGGGFASQWLPLMARLPGWRSFAVDRPGCGLTDPFDYRGTNLRRHAVWFLDSVLDALEIDRLPIVANSMGAMWGLFFAFERPERVSGLSLLGCPALLPGTGAPLWLRAFSSPLLRGVLKRLPRPSFDTMKRRMGGALRETAGGGTSEAELRTLFLSQALPGAMDSLGTLVEQLLTLWGPIAGAGIDAAELHRLAVPTQLIWGSTDPFGEVSAAERAVAAMPDAALAVVEAGHQPWTKRPEECGALVARFLEERATANAKAKPSHLA